MTPTRPSPPSRARYAAKHPAITVHFDLETYAEVVALRERTGLTLNQLVRWNLGSQGREIDSLLERGRQQGVVEGRAAGLNEGRRVGYGEAAAVYRLLLPCADCDQWIELKNGTEEVRALIAMLVDEGVTHETCPKPTRLRRVMRTPDVR